MLSDHEKEVFKAATERRKAAGIRLKRFSVMLDSHQLESVETYWNFIVEYLGKQHAGDFLIVALERACDALRTAIERRDAQKTPSKR